MYKRLSLNYRNIWVHADRALENRICLALIYGGLSTGFHSVGHSKTYALHLHHPSLWCSLHTIFCTFFSSCIFAQFIQKNWLRLCSSYFSTSFVLKRWKTKANLILSRYHGSFSAVTSCLLVIIASPLHIIAQINSIFDQECQNICTPPTLTDEYNTFQPLRNEETMAYFHIRHITKQEAGSAVCKNVWGDDFLTCWQQIDILGPQEASAFRNYNYRLTLAGTTHFVTMQHVSWYRDWYLCILRNSEVVLKRSLECFNQNVWKKKACLGLSQYLVFDTSRVENVAINKVIEDIWNELEEWKSEWLEKIYKYISITKIA